MSQLDLTVFLIAGIVGAVVSETIAWVIVGIWAGLKLLHMVQ